jgi:hypothetical protein
MAIAVQIATLGRMSKKRYLEDFASTFGPTQKYPAGWDKLSKRLLAHECRHTTHCVWLGWAIPIVGWFFGRRVRAWCGLCLYAPLYLLVLLPMGLAYFRYQAELDADRFAYGWALRHGYEKERIVQRASEFAKLVSGGSYGWAWPRAWTTRGFVRAADRALHDAGGSADASDGTT